MTEGKASEAGPSAIEVDGLTKRFGDFVAVDHVSFVVGEGEIFGLLGPNGAGKTTLIRMLTTLTPPSGGTARVAGHDVRKDADAVRNSIGVIPQALTSDPELTAEENLMIHAKLYGVPRERRPALVRELLEAVDLVRFGKALVATFSGGMRRRLEIARGLVHSPKILFLDEPTTGLDPVSRTNVWEMIEKLKKQSSLTILLTTHYMDEADKLCDRIAIVDHGKLVALDSPTRLKDGVPGNDVVEAEFEGAPADWQQALAALPQVVSVSERDGDTHIASLSGPDTVGAMMDLARDRGVTVRRVTVQSTTLDDVFLHYTGRQLRDEVAGKRRGWTSAISTTDEPTGHHPRPAGAASMKPYRIMAFIERDMRKFFRSPALMMTSMVFPLMQLIVLGYAFGGQIKNVRLGLVDKDRASESRQVRERLNAIVEGPQTFRRVGIFRSAGRDDRSARGVRQSRTLYPAGLFAACVARR